jgi:glucose/arabinose dehydrogenase
MAPMKLSPPRLALVMSGFLAACGTPPADPTSASPVTGAPTGAVSEPAATASATPRSTTPSAAASTPPSIAAEPPPIALETVVSGLDDPISIATAPDGWLLVNERAGRVVAVDPATGRTDVSLDLTDRVLGGGEQGLLGLALHPGWPDVARAFVHYTDRGGDTVVSEFTPGDLPTPARLDPASERILLRVDQPYANHNGGQLAFDTDGLLLVGLGDGGSGGDPHGHGQDPATLLGSILRIDVDGTPTDDHAYAIPADNPFADGRAGAPEVYMTGLRNPWRFSVDRSAGDLWIADVGQNALEEVNRVPAADAAGANLGWNVMEASQCFADAACSDDGLVLPVAEYGHDLGCSVTGGHVVRGGPVAGLRGWYVFGDYCSGLVFGVRSDAEATVAPRVLLESGQAISAFGEGTDGTLYVADLEAGTLSRIVPGG